MTLIPAEPLLAAMRDASWYRCPGRAGRYHVIVDGRAACNGRDDGSNTTMPLTVEHAVRAQDVDPVLRCRRAGCKVRWP